MHIELRPIDEVRPYSGNPRRNEAAVDAVARSLQAFGFRQPVVVDPEGVIVVGHTRWPSRPRRSARTRTPTRWTAPARWP